jgi:hypothetical protein
MIEIENLDVWGFEHAIRGMRNPMNSWNRIDSNTNQLNNSPEFAIGKNDLELMKRLAKAGQAHRKYLRQIFVSMDINAPLYWWKEFDTFKVGTVANSCSTMHKIHEKEFILSDFSHEHLNVASKNVLEAVISALNCCRSAYIGNVSGHKELIGDKEIWWQMIQLLPSSYNQRRTVTFNYENTLNMIALRENHKLDEWRKFVTILKTLPLIDALI